MLWMIPLAVALFWFDSYRDAMAMPPLWNLRAMTMQHGALLDFLPPVVGAAAWTGSRDSRRKVSDLMSVTARPRWTRQLTGWLAVTCWAMLTYLACVAVLYVMIARQAQWGGPLWWPAAVPAAGIPVLAAAGYAAGALVPSRFTAPVITIVLFLVLGFSEPLAHGGHSYGQISPLIAGAVDIGPDPGVASFYHYLPDLSIAQIMLLAGLAAATLGAVGLPASAGGRWLRAMAASLTAAGLLAAGTAVALVGTARLDPHGMMVIPALHDAANDHPVRYAPVCSRTAIPVCVNPDYAIYLADVTAALRPVLGELAGLPGAPARISQAAPVYRQEPANGISIVQALPAPGGSGAAGGSGATASSADLQVALAAPVPSQQDGVTTGEFIAEVRAGVAPQIVASVLPLPLQVRAILPRESRGSSQAIIAVSVALLRDAGVRLVSAGAGRSGQLIAPTPGPAPATPVYRPALRFAALPAAARHAWLAAHLTALRSGQVTLAQLP